MKTLFISLLLFTSFLIQAQVAINSTGASPDNSSMLDVSSTSKGMLVPRMTLAQRGAISSPANGLMIYQIDNGPGFYYNFGTPVTPVWSKVGTDNNWSLTGNSGTVAGTNFIGTTDNIPLVFKVNNNLAGKIDLSGNNSFGLLSLGSITYGENNSAFGTEALRFNIGGSHNTGVGCTALNSNISGQQNTAVGYNALFSNNADRNTAAGSYALYTNSVGTDNSAFGIDALVNNDAGSRNTALGAYSLVSQSYNPGSAWNSDNVAVGYSSLFSNQPNSTSNGIGNTATGNFSLYNNTTGSHNTANGFQASYSNTSGNSNVAIGKSALSNNTIRSKLVAVGDSALFNNGIGATMSYQAICNTAIGSKALYSNTIGYNNTAAGFKALNANTTGNDNSSFGAFGLSTNTTGSDNTSLGFGSLSSNTTGYDNTAVGVNALKNNTSANRNVAIGGSALMNLSYNPGYTWNSSNVALGYSALCFNLPTSIGNGINNTATGNYSLYVNTTGSNNTANGFTALYQNTTGTNNVAVGDGALYSNFTGSYNTAVGYLADVSIANLGDATAIGSNALTNANDKVVIGGPYPGTIVIGGYAGWSNFSDGRFKENVRQDVPGLSFIEKLNPVTYQVDNRALIDHLTQLMPDSVAQCYHKTEAEYARMYNKRLTGFIAQEVETAARETGFDFDGVNAPKNETDNYSLSYASFVVPLVKAVQEQQQEIEQLKAENEELQQRLLVIESKLSEE